MTMTTTNVSSVYFGTSMLPSMGQTQSTLASAGVEMSTGQYANIGLQLGDQSGYELSLKNEYEVLQSTTTSNSVITTNLTTAQDALNAILTGAQSAQTNLTTWTSESSTSPTTLQSIGASGLQALVSLANTTSNGSYVFGGENSGVAPMNVFISTPASAAQTAVDGAFQAELTSTGTTASTITAAQMQTFLTGSGSGSFSALFSTSGSPSAWSTNWSSASSTNTSAQIAPGETVDTSTNANQAGFQQLAEGYAMLSEFGNAGLSPAALQVVTTTAMSLISQGVASITAQTANVGASLAQVTDANSSMSSQMTILQTQIGNLDNVNTTTVATEITQLSTQLQTAYSLTAQLEKLSLAQYLPT
jgi:flagellar hook-associated protein 3 FlgL